MSDKNISQKVRSLQLIWEWSEYYDESIPLINQTNDAEKIEPLRDEIGEFLDALDSAWLGARFKRLKPDNQQKLKTIYKSFRKAELSLSSRILELEENKELMKSMEDLAFPEDFGENEHRDFVSWAMSPVYFSKEFLEKFSEDT